MVIWISDAWDQVEQESGSYGMVGKVSGAEADLEELGAHHQRHSSSSREESHIS